MPYARARPAEPRLEFPLSTQKQILGISSADFAWCP